MSGHSDVTVVGAGVIGAAIAYELARRGAAVCLVDDRSPGMGATQASAGVLAPFIEARTEGPLLELTVRSLDLFDEFIAQVGSATDLPVTYCRTGSLDVALDQATLQQLGAAAGSLAARGVTAEWLDAAAVRRQEPQLSGHVLGGLLVPSQGFVNAMELTRALVDAASRLGATVSARCRVKRIRRHDEKLAAVETDRGLLTAGCVVLAAGTWAGQIAVEGVSSPVPVRPVRGQLLQLAWHGPSIRRVTWSERCYLVPWGDGTLLVGATVEDVGFEERTTAAGVHDLLDWACEVVPSAADAGFTAAKAGLRPGTPDGLPVIGRSAAISNLVYATGHYRNGVLLSPLTARLVAALVLENRSDDLLEITRPDRFGRL